MILTFIEGFRSVTHFTRNILVDFSHRLLIVYRLKPDLKLGGKLRFLVFVSVFFRHRCVLLYIKEQVHGLSFGI